MEEGITRIAKQWLGTFCIVYFFSLLFKKSSYIKFSYVIYISHNDTYKYF